MIHAKPEHKQKLPLLRGDLRQGKLYKSLPLEIVFLDCDNKAIWLTQGQFYVEIPQTNWDSAEFEEIPSVTLVSDGNEII